MKKTKIRARLTIWGHDELKGAELRKFRKWVKMLGETLPNYKAGDISKVFKATLYD